MNTRRLLAVVASVSLALVILAPAAFAAPKAAPDKVTVRTDFSPGGKDTPYYLARARGYYDDVNLDVTIQPGKSSVSTLQLVAANQETFGIIDAAVYVQSRSEG